MKQLFFGLVFIATICAQGATLDALAAKVGNQVLTVSDVINEMRRTSKGVDAPNFPVAYSNAVQSLIDRKLILKAAADKKMDMQEWMVDNRVREIVKDVFEGDKNKLNAALAESKIPITEWRNTIREDMIVSGMRYQIVDRVVTAPPAAMQREYTQHPERYTRNASTTVSIILLRPAAANDSKTPSVADRAQTILNELAKGVPFAQLAKTYSADSHAKDGGAWKDIDPKEAFRPEIAQTIADLKVGQMSKLVALEDWGFIVRKDAQTEEKQLSFAEAYDEIARNVRRTRADEAYAAWIGRLRAQTFIKLYPLPTEK